MGRPQRAHQPFTSDPGIPELARFARSPSGRALAQLCVFWGFDPGTWATDDVIAMNIRAAFMMALADTPESEAEETEADVARKHWQGVAQARRYGDMLRSAFSG